MDIKSEYKTKDLAEASFLLVKGKIIQRIERINHVCWFIFQNELECRRLSDLFWFGNSTVNGKSFYEAIQTLKNRIFSKR